jgi:hydroxypyruvate reductase
LSSRTGRARLRRAAGAILEKALVAAAPARLVEEHLRVRAGVVEAGGVRFRPSRGRVALVAAGKAAVAMARAAEHRLGRHLSEGIAVTNAKVDGLEHVRVLTASHPVPDARGLAAARQIEEFARGLGRDDLLLVLLSGGASALLPAPAEGLTLDDKQRTTEALLRGGATIHELNAVRKHLSRLKGGGLARAAAPARVVALVLSDVVGDDLSTIASGPTSPDPTTYADAVAVLTRRGLLATVPRAVRARLEAGVQGSGDAKSSLRDERRPRVYAATRPRRLRPAPEETPKPGDPIFRRVTTRIVGSNRLSVAAAAREARREGLRPVVLTTYLEGEAREAARVLVAILRECVETGRPASTPVCLIAGGETTVTVSGAGQGGRNQELAVAAAAALAGFRVPAVVASFGTDGIDGASDAAGGVVDDETTARAAALGLAPASTFLGDNDTRNYLGPLGDLILTGPTGTNVCDVVVALAGRPSGRRL